MLVLVLARARASAKPAPVLAPKLLRVLAVVDYGDDYSE